MHVQLCDFLDHCSVILRELEYSKGPLAECFGPKQKCLDLKVTHVEIREADIDRTTLIYSSILV